MQIDENRYQVLLMPRQLRFDVSRSETLLQAAQRAGVTLPASCRNGTCRTCMCRLHAGQVQYRIEWPGLTAEEKKEGFILPCVAYPASDLVVDAPAARAATPA